MPMLISANEQAILSGFHSTLPDLSRLHADFLDYASDAIDGMTPPVRFGMHDAGGVFEPDHFISTFGIDTSHRLHPIKQLWVVQRMLERDFPNIDGRDREDLLLTATVHDMGEPFSTHGDAIADTKTVDQDTEEDNKRHEVLRAIAPTWAEEIIGRTEPILSDPSSPNFATFKLSERIGYLLTARTSALIYLGPKNLDPRQRTIAGMITTDVLYRTHAKVVGSRGEQGSYLDTVLHAVTGPLKVAEMQLKQEAPEHHALVLANL
jgi:hypothetical protein